jgi:hypothetical protein
MKCLNFCIFHFYLIQKLEQLRVDNIKLRTEISEARVQLNSRDTLIRDLQKQLSEQQTNKGNIPELKVLKCFTIYV